jgi:hypothetical protein
MTTAERLKKLEELKGRVEADLTTSPATREYASAILEFVVTWVAEIELLESRLVPPFSNGMPRVLWDDSDPTQPPLTILVTEKAGASLMAADSGLLLESRYRGGSGVGSSLVEVTARRIAPAPTLTVLPG